MIIVSPSSPATSVVELPSALSVLKTGAVRRNVPSGIKFFVTSINLSSFNITECCRNLVGCSLAGVTLIHSDIYCSQCLPANVDTEVGKEPDQGYNIFGFAESGPMAIELLAALTEYLGSKNEISGVASI